jgi:hypothetical protein
LRNFIILAIFAFKIAVAKKYSTRTICPRNTRLFPVMELNMRNFKSLWSQADTKLGNSIYFAVMRANLAIHILYFTKIGYNIKP